MYGPKEASRSSHHHLARGMVGLGFEQCNVDTCVWFSRGMRANAVECAVRLYFFIFRVAANDGGMYCCQPYADYGKIRDRFWSKSRRPSSRMPIYSSQIPGKDYNGITKHGLCCWRVCVFVRARCCGRICVL